VQFFRLIQSSGHPRITIQCKLQQSASLSYMPYTFTVRETLSHIQLYFESDKLCWYDLYMIHGGPTNIIQDASVLPGAGSKPLNITLSPI
jgi:hypothetical protein